MRTESILLIGRGDTLKYYMQGMINRFSKEYRVLVIDRDDIVYEGEHQRLSYDWQEKINTGDNTFWTEIKQMENAIGLNLFDAYSNYFYYGRLAQEANIKSTDYWRTKDELGRQYYSAYIFFEKLFNAYDVKFIYHDTIDMIFTQVLEAFSKKNRIGFYHTFIIPGVFNNRLLLGTGIKRINYLFYKCMHDDTPPTEEEKAVVRDIRQRFSVGKPKMSYLNEVSQKVITYNEVKRLVGNFKNIQYGFKRVLNRLWLKRHSQDFEIGRCGKYILYFMSHQPEATTTSVAQDWVDQWKIVEEIAVHAPSDINVVIKPHPFGYGWQGRDYYEKLIRLPNVYLAPVGYDGKELIQKAVGVVTINGSIALEAMLYKTPAYVLDRVWYSYPGYIERIYHPKEIHEKFEHPKILNDDEIEKVLLSAYRASVDFFVSYSLGNEEKKIVAGEALANHIMLHSDIYFQREVEAYEPKY